MEIKHHMEQFIEDYFTQDTNFREQPVVQLSDKETFDLLGGLTIPEVGRPVDVMVDVLRQHVYPNRSISEHPRNFAFIPAPIEDVSKLGDMINTFYNPNACGWYPSSGTSYIEHSLIDWLCQQAGYTTKASGIFVSGGSTANLTAAIAARDAHLAPDDITKGVVYISNQAHHSVNKALHVIGIPNNHIRRVATTADLKINPEALDQQISSDIEAGLKPFLIIATAGTTNAGVIDPLEDIGRIAQERRLWFHVDGAFGASLLLSGNYKHLVQGIETADSITWDAHKWLFQTYSCAMLLVKDRQTLLNSFSDDPEYLEDAHQDDLTNFWDLGIELSRPARGVKLWLSLQTLGTQTIGEQIDYGVQMAEYTQSIIEKDPNWELITPAQAAILTFRYTNPKFTDSELNRLNTKLSEAITQNGFAHVLTTKLNGMTVLRMCTISPDTTKEDIHDTLQFLNTQLDSILQSL